MDDRGQVVFPTMNTLVPSSHAAVIWLDSDHPKGILVSLTSRICIPYRDPENMAHKLTLRILLSSLFLLFLGTVTVRTASAQDVTLEVPGTVVSDIPFSVTVAAVPGPKAVAGELRLTNGDDGNGQAMVRMFWLDDGGRAVINDLVVTGSGYVATATIGSAKVTESLNIIPGLFTLLPPVAAIACALIFRQVLLALAAGGFLGAFLAPDQPGYPATQPC